MATKINIESFCFLLKERPEIWGISVIFAQFKFRTIFNHFISSVSYITFLLFCQLVIKRFLIIIKLGH